MNDTNRLVLNQFLPGLELSSSEIQGRISDSLSLVTVKRALSALQNDGYIERVGSGRSTRYKLTRMGVLLRPVDTTTYFDQPQESRIHSKLFNHDLIRGEYVSLLSDSDMASITKATDRFLQKSDGNEGVQAKELQRFVIEMSWKDGRIEGNTYTLLDTERLLAHGIPSAKNSQFETQMLLNQKAAFDFVWEMRDGPSRLNIAFIEKVQEFIANNLGIDRGLRSSVVGIVGTEYQPLANKFQIKESLEQLLKYIESAPNSYEKALMFTVGLSYIQPFVDGNKRTARMIANSILLSDGKAPISYRSVDESAYKESLLVFYEQNSATPFRNLFVDQYIYSATHYNVGDGDE